MQVRRTRVRMGAFFSRGFHRCNYLEESVGLTVPVPTLDWNLNLCICADGEEQGVPVSCRLGETDEKQIELASPAL